MPVEHPGPVGHVSEAVVTFSRAGRQIEADAIIGYPEYQASVLQMPRCFQCKEPCSPVERCGPVTYTSVVLGQAWLGSGSPLLYASSKL